MVKLCTCAFRLHLWAWTLTLQALIFRAVGSGLPSLSFQHSAFRAQRLTPNNKLSTPNLDSSSFSLELSPLNCGLSAVFGDLGTSAFRLSTLAFRRSAFTCEVLALKRELPFPSFERLAVNV